jgi:hypothetical protein
MLKDYLRDTYLKVRGYLRKIKHKFFK